MTWTDEMRANLIELSKTKKDAHIARILGRSERSIRLMRFSMNVSKTAKKVKAIKERQPNTEFFDWADYNNEII